MTTTEKNILVAEFMGEPLPYINEEGHWEYYVPNAGRVSSPTIEGITNFLKYNYDEDWSRIMQVVELIAELKFWSINATLEWLNDEYECDGFYGVDDVFEACVMFIKEYNEYNKD